MNKELIESYHKPYGYTVCWEIFRDYLKERFGKENYRDIRWEITKIQLRMEKNDELE